jgi:hypothetical protein
MRTSIGLAEACLADGEFRLAARYWTGGLHFDFELPVFDTIRASPGPPSE